MESQPPKKRKYSKITPSNKDPNAPNEYEPAHKSRRIDKVYEQGANIHTQAPDTDVDMEEISSLLAQSTIQDPNSTLGIRDNCYYCALAAVARDEITNLEETSGLPHNGMLDSTDVAQLIITLGLGDGTSAFTHNLLEAETYMLENPSPSWAFGISGAIGGHMINAKILDDLIYYYDHQHMTRFSQHDLFNRGPFLFYPLNKSWA